jgi:hypothetical protein
MKRYLGHNAMRPCGSQMALRKRYVPTKSRVTSTRLHGVISQKTEIFITTAV